MKPYRSKEEVEAMLAPRDGRLIQESIDAAIEAYRKDYSPGTRLIHSRRTRASILYDHIVAQLHKRFDKLSGAHFIRRRGLTLLALKEELLVRFKKLTNKKRASSIRTLQATMFNEQSPQLVLGLPGVAERTTNLIAGYIFDELESRAKQILVTCPGAKANWWDLPLTRTTAVVRNMLPRQGRERKSPFSAKETARRQRKNRKNGNGTT